MVAPMNIGFHWPDFLSHFARAAQAAGFSESILAETPAGPLTVWERTASGPRVYLSAGIHGDEPAGPLALLELLREGFFEPSEVDWALCPALNPTGLAAGTRHHADGVDLNRDYWHRSTREVAGHAAWLAAGKLPELFISLHEDWESSGFYLYEINLAADDPTRSAEILSAVEPWFHSEAGPDIDGHQSRGPGWIFHAAEADLPEAWPEAIFLSKRGCPLSFTFETPSHRALHDRVAAQCAAVRAACRRLSEQVRQR